MAKKGKKKSLFGAIAFISAAAAATAAVYANRKEIRALLEDAAERFLPVDDEPETEPESWEENDDTDIVIDRTSAAGAEDGEAEETPAE